MKTKNFIQRNGITIVAFAFLAVFGIGWYVTGQSATTNIGEDIVVGGNLSVGGNQVITSAGVLQNVTADAGIITSGTFDNARTSGVSTNTANTLVLRDANARFRAGTPDNNADVATKEYVDNAVAGAGGGAFACTRVEHIRTSSTASASCPAGTDFVLTGGCRMQATHLSSFPTVWGWHCRSSQSASEIQAYAICCSY